MNKTELVEAVATSASLSKKDAEAAVKATFEAVTERYSLSASAHLKQENVLQEQVITRRQARQ